MGENLGTKQLGGTDQAFAWFLHTSGVAVAGGARIADGGGNDTGLVVGSNWIGIHGSGGFQATLTYGGGANITLALPTMGTALVSNTGNGVTKADFLASLGIVHKVVTADVTNATTSAVDVSELDFTPAADGVYRFEYLIRIQSTNTGTDVNLDILGPAQTDEVVAGKVLYTGSAEGTGNVYSQMFNSFPAALNGATLAVADAGQLVMITGLLKMTASAATSDLALKLRAGNTSGTAKIMAGSSLRIEKLN